MTVVPEEPPVLDGTEEVESTEKVVVKKQVVVKKPVVKKAVKKSENGVIARDLMLNPKTGDTSMTINFVVIAISIIALFAVNRKKSITMKK